jgi:predicted DNA-binding protein with PD1-like motif
MRCVGVGKCRRVTSDSGVMCPSYMVTREEKHSTRGRAHLLFEMTHGGVIEDGWRSEAVEDALKLCLACKGCKSDCPVGVDMAIYKAEFRSHHYAGRLRPRAAYSMGLIHRWARAAAYAPGLTNALVQAPGLGTLAKTIGGIDRRRRLPAFARRDFRRWFRDRRGPTGGSRVLLWCRRLQLPRADRTGHRPPHAAYRRTDEGNDPMMTRLLADQGGLRTYAVILEIGDEAMACLNDFARSEGIDGAKLSAIGAFRRAMLLYFDWETKEYLEIPVEEQVEVASLSGDIGIDEEGNPALHVHLVLGRSDGTALAGHLKSAEVRPTLEVIITETPGHVRRRHDSKTGLALIQV